VTIRAVLFDIGGPIDTEAERERYIDAQIVRALAGAGFSVSAEQFAAANDAAVASFAPSVYGSIIWQLSGCDPDVAERAYCAFHDSLGAMPPIELRPGIRELLAGIVGRGLMLGLAANQPSSALAALDGLGVGQFFKHREVSGIHGFRKPDVRLFLRCCDELSVEPAECVVVGDRIDNDIVPARMLGMRSVLFRVGRHIAQQPRSHDDVPDAEVRSVDELARALSELIGVDV